MRGSTLRLRLCNGTSFAVPCRLDMEVALGYFREYQRWSESLVCGRRRSSCRLRLSSLEKDRDARCLTPFWKPGIHVVFRKYPG